MLAQAHTLEDISLHKYVEENFKDIDHSVAYNCAFDEENKTENTSNEKKKFRIETDSAFIYFGDTARNIDSLYSYYSLFNHRAKYDIKREECWNEFFSIPYPGWGTEFWFNGYIMTPEILGNYLYGLTGCYWGFPGIVIHQGAGYAQKGTTAYLDRPDLYFGDNEEDYYWIKQAIIDSNSTARVSIDLSGLAKNSKIWDAAIGLLK